MNESANKVLIVGATGMLGRPVAKRLLRSGFDIRVMSSDAPRAKALFPTLGDIVQADVRDPASLRPVIDGCKAVHINLRGLIGTDAQSNVEVTGVRNLLAVARELGVQHISYLSGAGELERYGHLPAIAVKLAAESAIRSSDIGYTIFRCTHFHESLDLFVRQSRATIIGRQPHRYHYLAADDYARCVETALSASAQNMTYTLLGPDPYTMREALEIYKDALNPALKIDHMPLFAAKTIGAITRNAELRSAARLFAAFEQVAESGDTEPAKQRFGRCTMTLADWCNRRMESNA